MHDWSFKLLPSNPSRQEKKKVRREAGKEESDLSFNKEAREKEHRVKEVNERSLCSRQTRDSRAGEKESMEYIKIR